MVFTVGCPGEILLKISAAVTILSNSFVHAVTVTKQNGEYYQRIDVTTLTYYKIRKKSDPTQFRKADGNWNTSGKVYDTLGKLRAIITMHMNSHSEYHRNQIQDWEFVEYEVSVKEVRQLIDIVKPERVWNLLKK